MVAVWFFNLFEYLKIEREIRQQNWETMGNIYNRIGDKVFP